MRLAASVIIVTKDRQDQLQNCLLSLSQSTIQNFELIVVDQSAHPLTSIQKSIFSPFKNAHYFHSQKIGKSNGLNFAITKATTPLLAFTDDDCIVDKKWLESIIKSFKNHPQCSAVFGRSRPYFPNKNVGKICPAIFDKPTKKIITLGCEHWLHIGFGNNMAIRKVCFEDGLAFNNMLGPGSIGSNAEDADIALRLILNKRKILYNPNAIISHNKWLTEDEFLFQQFSYICGEIACYGALALETHDFARKVILKNLSTLKYVGVEAFVAAIHIDKKMVSKIKLVCLYVLAFLRGGYVAILIVLLSRKSSKAKV